MVGNLVSEWNFSKQYADLWKEDEEKMMACIYNKDFSGAGNILLTSMTRYPKWALKKDGEPFDPITFYEEYMKEVARYEELQVYSAPGSEKQVSISETKINKKIAEGRIILHEMLDAAGILLRKVTTTNEEEIDDLGKRYAQGR